MLHMRVGSCETSPRPSGLHRPAPIPSCCACTVGCVEGGTTLPESHWSFEAGSTQACNPGREPARAPPLTLGLHAVVLFDFHGSRKRDSVAPGAGAGQHPPGLLGCRRRLLHRGVQLGVQDWWKRWGKASKQAAGAALTAIVYFLEVQVHIESSVSGDGTHLIQPEPGFGMVPTRKP